MNDVALGLRQNWRQFVLLVIINAFVGGMVGLERTILPALAEGQFGLAAKTAILSFIVVFGVSKALTNFFAGSFADRVGRKNLLVIGWLFALPIPFILIYAEHWHWIVAANILLGINQGLTWSSTVVMKIDLVGDKQRGLAMGLNESAGYLAVGGVAFLTGWIASEYGIRPYPFYLGMVFTVAGLFLSLLWVKDTVHHVARETQSSGVAKLKKIVWETTWKDKNLGSISQAGLVNNLNDGMVWGIFPMILAGRGFGLDEIARIVAIYPVVWGLGQLVTGKMADHFNKKNMLFLGMLFQGLALLTMAWATGFFHFVFLSIVLGIGTAVVYPTFLAAIGDFTHPSQRAKSIGVFRLWRDLGYAIGALLTGFIADSFGLVPSVYFIALLTIVSSFIIAIRMTKPVIHDCISIGEVKKLIDSGAAIRIIDVRSPTEYETRHIGGAENIPLDQLAGRLGELTGASLVVTVCGKGGGRSATGSGLVNEAGHSPAAWLCGGTDAWYA